MRTYRHRFVAMLLMLLSLCACGASSGSLPVARGALGARPPALTAGASQALGVTRGAAATVLAIDAGSSTAIGSWKADTAYTAVAASNVAAVSRTIKVTGVTDPAPQSVYQTQRYASHLTYSIPNLTPGATYTLRTHFVESFWTGSGKRVFSVRINGAQVLSNFDIFKAAGGLDIAIAPQFNVEANAGGTVTVQLDASVNSATIAAIEVLSSAANPTPAPTPAPTSSPGTYADGHLPPPGWTFPYSVDPFTVAACPSDPCSPALDANSAAEAGRVVAAGGALDLGDIFEGVSTDNDFPVYYASASDPPYTVSCDSGGCGTGTISVKIPNGAYASGGSDHHLTVIDAASGVETDFWEFNDNGTGTGSTNPVYGGGTLSAASGGVCRQSSFVGHKNSCANSATGSGLPIQALALDPREILAGSVNHTLYVAVGCGQNGFSFPADFSDGTCGSGPKYGQRVWLDLTDAQIDALGDPAWATTLLHAMHHYGWTVSDSNGGTGAVAFGNLAPQSFTIWGQANPWTQFFAAAGTSKYVTLPTRGISQSNIHILAPCVNTQSC